jgi:UDP-N-acetylmuramyl pentapeptide synthase
MRDGALVLRHGEIETPLPRLMSIQATGGYGALAENTLAAAAAAWALGIVPELIQAGIKTHFTERNMGQGGDPTLIRTRSTRSAHMDSRLQD